MPARRPVQSVDQLNFLGKSMYYIKPCLRRKSVGIDGASIGIHALPGGQLTNLVEIEVARVVAAVVAVAVRKTKRDISHPVDMDVVQHNELIVARCNHILFEEISAHRMGHRFGGSCVLRDVARSTAMGNNNRSHPLNHPNPSRNPHEF